MQHPPEASPNTRAGRLGRMPRAPKLASFPAIRGALKFYQVCSVITGVGLLLLCAEMVLKYTPLHVELFLGGSGGFLWFAPVVEGVDGLVSTGDGLNLSLGILVVHGWFYVVYLFACFRMWSLMRWNIVRLATLAAGGVIPFLSFFMEARVGREVKTYLDEREAAEHHTRSEHSSLTHAIPTENKR